MSYAILEKSTNDNGFGSLRGLGRQSASLTLITSNFFAPKPNQGWMRERALALWKCDDSMVYNGLTSIITDGKLTVTFVFFNLNINLKLLHICQNLQGSSL